MHSNGGMEVVLVI